MKRALVLSGGGSKGAYECGFLLAAKELNQHFDIVTGTSIGALNGALVAMGDYEGLEYTWDILDMDHVFNNAPDLTDLRDEVYELRDHYNFKGMYIFQFHFKEEFDFDKVVVYSGTHDNDTLMGWYNNLDKKTLKDVDLLLEGYKERKLHRQMIHYCMDLPAESVIIPVWDLLGEPETSRFNTPGTIGSPNWEWKMSRFTEFNKEMKFMKKIIHDTNRDETL